MEAYFRENPPLCVDLDLIKRDLRPADAEALIDMIVEAYDVPDLKSVWRDQYNEAKDLPVIDLGDR